MLAVPVILVLPVEECCLFNQGFRYRYCFWQPHYLRLGMMWAVPVILVLPVEELLSLQPRVQIQVLLLATPLPPVGRGWQSPVILVLRVEELLSPQPGVQKKVTASCNSFFSSEECRDFTASRRISAKGFSAPGICFRFR